MQTKKTVDCLNGCGPMSRLVYESQVIDICETCAGVWLDSNELRSILLSKELAWSEKLIRRILQEIGDLEVAESEVSRDLECPVCNKALPPSNFQDTSNIIINSCDEGHGVWLDAGELLKVQVYIENRSEDSA